MPYDAATMAKHKERMTRGEVVPVTLVTHYEKRTEGHVRLLHLTPDEAGGAARKWLLIWLLLTPVVIVFPPHFLWPLVALATGVVGYYMRRGQRAQVVGGEATCPECGAFQILEDGNAEFPMAHFCSECRERSLLEPTKPIEAPKPS